VRYGETVTPPRNRKSGNGNPSPTAKRATILPDTGDAASGGRSALIVLMTSGNCAQRDPIEGRGASRGENR